MAQASLTSFYTTRRGTKDANIKNAKNDLFSEKVTREVTIQRDLNKTPKSRIVEPASDRKVAPLPKTSKRSSKTTVSKNADIRGYFIKRTETPTRSHVDKSGEGQSSAKKRVSSPTKEANVPKRARKSLKMDDVTSGPEDAEILKEGATSSVSSQSSHAAEAGESSKASDHCSPAKSKVFKNVNELKARLKALKEKTDALDRRRAAAPMLSPDRKGSNTVTFEVPASPSGFPTTLSPSPRKKIQADKTRSPATPAYVRYSHLLEETPILSPSGVQASSASPRKKSPVGKKAPAYSRFKHLLEETPALSPTEVEAARNASVVTPADARLDLPVVYKSLLESFKSLDIIVSLLYNRKDVPIYLNKVRTKVRQLSHLNFTEATLGRIQAVYPEGYDLAMEEITVLEAEGKKLEYHLVLRPKGIKEGLDARGRITQVQLKARLDAVEKKLLAMVHERHNEFLKSLKPPVDVPTSEIRRWHPEFMLESVPQIVPAVLPKKPEEDKPAMAKDILDQAKRQLFDACPRIVAALEKTSAASGGKENDKKTDKDFPKPVEAVPKPAPRPTPKDLKKFSSKLLEKIREKEAAKNMRAMVMTADEEQHLARLKRLPDLAKLVHGMFVAEKKTVIPLDHVVDRLTYSYTGALSGRLIREHLDLLAKEMKGEKIPNAVTSAAVDDWIKVNTASDGTTFIRLEKRSDVNLVVNRILEKIQTAS